MKTISTFLIISALIPGLLFAQSTTTESNFCTRLDVVLQGIDTKSISLQAKRLPNTNQASKSEILLGNVSAKRTEVETAKLVLLNELQGRVKTPEQQAALDKFTLAARDATNIKNNALDLLVKNNQASIASMLALRDIEVAKATTTLRTTLEAAKAKAKADCAAGVSPQTVRATLSKSVEEALTSFRNQVASIQKNRTISESTRALKNEEVKKIMNTYKKSMETARKELKIALKQALPTATTTR